MSIWSIALAVIGVIGVAACRQETAPPPREAATSAPISEPETAQPATVEPEPATTEPATSAPPPPTATMEAPKPPPPRRAARTPIRSFAVYAVSRGKGVPEEASEALRRVVALAEEDQRRGVKVTVTKTRIGIEGEMRACLSYEEEQEGARACERARAIVKNVDLVNLAVERCEEAANNRQEKP
jgi:hypothetical protein